jgi:putative glutamine amidotransferase
MLIAVTQRVDLTLRPNGPAERRDALDQAWTRFLDEAGCRPLILPNHAPTALALLGALPAQGLLLTGGEDLASLGGEAPERDETETALLAAARRRRLPVIGVCRGMQLIQQAFGVTLSPVAGHVAPRQAISIDGAPAAVNSYHAWGARGSAGELAVWARAADGVVKAVRHVREPIVGVMWHPERLHPFAARDLDLFRQVFGAERELTA